ncbi:unnamed protein product [Haemonchus placei]|uniref:Uncharacterized protein n=1 Tax=Haemonchus placei TaxID=6290 RepID=A0A3P7UEK3_HAEPC|nr:unnamed protein product [Haemonchus placei]
MYDRAGAPVSDTYRVNRNGVQPTGERTWPAPVGSDTRNTTGDSDEYVKVSSNRHAPPTPLFS